MTASLTKPEIAARLMLLAADLEAAAAVLDEDEPCWPTLAAQLRDTAALARSWAPEILAAGVP